MEVTNIPSTKLEKKVVSKPLTHAGCDLYSGPLPISRAKYKDLNCLSKFLRRAAQMLYAGLLVDDAIIDLDSESVDVDGELDQVESLGDTDEDDEQ